MNLLRASNPFFDNHFHAGCFLACNVEYGIRQPSKARALDPERLRNEAWLKTIQERNVSSAVEARLFREAHMHIADGMREHALEVCGDLRIVRDEKRLALDVLHDVLQDRAGDSHLEIAMSISKRADDEAKLTYAIECGSPAA